MKSVLYVLLSLSLCTSAYGHKERWDGDKSEWSKLMFAIYNGQTDSFLNLIKTGEDINFRTKDCGFQLSAMDVAIFKQNEKAVKALLETNKLLDPGSYIMRAAPDSSVFIIKILIKYGADPGYANENGHTALMLASSFGSAGVMECLLKHGANVQARKGGEITALMLAAMSGKVDNVKLLLGYNADKNALDSNGKRAFDYVDMIYEYLHVSSETKEQLKSLLR